MKKITGYFVVSDTTEKELGGPYKTRTEAIRLGLRLPDTYGHVSLLKLKRREFRDATERAARHRVPRSK